MTKEISAGDKGEDMREIAERNYSDFMRRRDELERERNFLLLGQVMDNYRKETGKYIRPDYSMENSNRDFEHRLARQLDPAGKYFEDAGEIESAKESRIAQARAFISGENKNYDSAAVLYEHVGEYKKAIESYQSLLADSKNRPWNSEMTLETESNISRLEKKIAKHNSMKKGKLASLSVSILGLISGLFFLSPIITGNAISNISSATSSLVGSTLFAIGIISGFFWTKSGAK